MLISFWSLVCLHLVAWNNQEINPSSYLGFLYVLFFFFGYLLVFIYFKEICFLGGEWEERQFSLKVWSLVVVEP